MLILIMDLINGWIHFHCDAALIMSQLAAGCFLQFLWLSVLWTFESADKRHLTVAVVVIPFARTWGGRIIKYNKI